MIGLVGWVGGGWGVKLGVAKSERFIKRSNKRTGVISYWALKEILQRR